MSEPRGVYPVEFFGGPSDGLLQTMPTLQPLVGCESPDFPGRIAFGYEGEFSDGWREVGRYERDVDRAGNEAAWRFNWVPA